MLSLQKGFSIWVKAWLLALLGTLLVFGIARADVAPPEGPPSVIISPGNETTQVRMVSEVVTLTVISSSDPVGKAKTTATFLMRNLGSIDEKMDVRFPLTFGEALYYTNLYAEINDFNVQVDGKSAATNRITSVDDNSGKTIPWASFPVRFPAGQDVTIRATYTSPGFGYEPFLSFRYILETGAGWQDTIGSGDIVVQLPYQASAQNVLIDPAAGFSKAAGGPVFSGNEVRWHFENLEPTNFENFQVDLISVVAWRKVLTERENTSKKPQDGEAWGRLGKAIKESLRYPKGYMREDEGVKQLYPEAVQAYEKAVTLLPDDALWHYGFADLLWSHYFYSVYSSGSQDYSELTRFEQELQQSLKIDPANQNARDLAGWAAGQLPWALLQSGQDFNYLVLTATPTYEPETATPGSEAVLQPSSTPTANQPAATIQNTVSSSTALPPSATKLADATKIPAATQPAPAARNPICGSMLLAPLLLGLLWFISKRQA